MALNQECHHCGHIQLVGLIENGRSGFPDPRARCEKCKRRGTFYYPSPGAPELFPSTQPNSSAHSATGDGE